MCLVCFWGYVFETRSVREDWMKEWRSAFTPDFWLDWGRVFPERIAFSQIFLGGVGDRAFGLCIFSCLRLVWGFTALGFFLFPEIFSPMRRFWEKGFGGFCGVGRDVGEGGGFGLRRRILRRSLSVASSNLAAILEREQRMAIPGTARMNPGITGTGPNRVPTIKSRPPSKIIPQCLAADSFFRVFR